MRLVTSEYMLQRLLFAVREFDLEESINCEISSLIFFDGIGSNVPSLKYCGTKLPGITRSTGNVVTFQLFTNSSTSMGGFRIDYSAVSLTVDSPHILLPEYQPYDGTRGEKCTMWNYSNIL